MSSADETAIQNVIQAYFDRLSASDVTKVMDLYTEDAAVMLPGQATVAGARQVSAAYKALFGAFAVNETCQFDDIRVRGDMAAVRTTSSGTVTVRATGDTNSASYRELFRHSASRVGFGTKRPPIQIRPPRLTSGARPMVALLARRAHADQQRAGKAVSGACPAAEQQTERRIECLPSSCSW